MSVKRKCKVVMLPTKKSVILLNPNNNKLVYWVGSTPPKIKEPEDKIIYQNLYILSDEEIVKDDWYCSPSGIISKRNNTEILPNDWKKIIATTDSSLTIEQNIGKLTINPNCWDEHKVMQTKTISLPQPSPQFIQKYVDAYNKGNEIIEVMVEYTDCDRHENCNSDFNNKCSETNCKINPKDNTITISKCKDSWSREEIIKLIQSKIDEYAGDAEGDIEYVALFDFQDWIEENL